MFQLAKLSNSFGQIVVNGAFRGKSGKGEEKLEDVAWE